MKVADRQPTSVSEAFESFEQVKQVKSAVEFHKDQCRKYREDINRFYDAHPIQGRLADDNGLFRNYENQKDNLREAENKLDEFYADQDHHRQSEAYAISYNEGIEEARARTDFLSSDFERGKKEIPEG